LVGEVASGNLADQVVNSALRYRGQAPLVDSLLAEIGLKSESLHGLVGAAKDVTPNGDSSPDAPPQ